MSNTTRFGSPFDRATEHLDAAIAALNSSNRDALLLRFFEGASLRTVAQKLGISEDAAKQRVSRAVEKMRAFLSAKGVALPEAAFMQFLFCHATIAPPAGLVDATVAAATGQVLKGVVFTVAALKVKTAVGVAVAAAVLAGGSIVAWHVLRPAGPTNLIITPLTDASGWRENFTRIYGLAENQQVKLVPAPFIPERKLFWLAEQRKAGNLYPEQIDDRQSLVLESDGTSFRWRSMSFMNSLDYALEQVAGIKRSELDASIPTKTVMKGDWIVRTGATKEQIANGISSILSRQLGRTVRLEQRRAMRDTLVARGTYQFTPLPGKADNGIIEIIGEPPPGAMPSRIYSVQLSELLSGVAKINGLDLIDETKSGAVTVTIADHPQFGDPAAVLRNLTSQTSLHFEHEQVDGLLWFLVDSNGNPIQTAGNRSQTDERENRPNG